MFNPSSLIGSRLLLLKFTAGLMLVCSFIMANPADAKAESGTCISNYGLCMTPLRGHDLSDPACCTVYYLGKYQCDVDRCICNFGPGNSAPLSQCMMTAFANRQQAIAQCQQNGW